MRFEESFVYFGEGRLQSDAGLTVFKRSFEVFECDETGGSI
jgi:hypothetical protein